MKHQRPLEFAVLDDECAECERLRAALKRVELYPFDVMSDAVADLAAVKEIARSALGEADDE